MSRAHRRISRGDDWHSMCPVGRIQLNCVSAKTHQVMTNDILWDSKPSLEGVPPRFASVELVVAMSIGT